ncbi:MAG: hypothetical protein KBA23_02785 [Amaricoccus sp.]|nr:hypothetical protein [Amaricoccus sp.]
MDVLASGLVVVGDGRCTRTTSAAPDGCAPAFSRLLRRATEAQEAGSEPSSDPADANSQALAGVLGVLPKDHVVLVAEVFERDPSALAQKMAHLGGRLLQRRPAHRAFDAEAPRADPAKGHAL